jgi:hypothetical protein
MNWIIGTLLVLVSAVGGRLGWWKGTRDLASPPDRYSAAGSADDRCRAAPEAHNDPTLLQRAHSVRLIPAERNVL